MWRDMMSGCLWFLMLALFFVASLIAALADQAAFFFVR